MKIIGSDHAFQLNEGIAATIGFFDGVHTGHRYLLEQLKEQADTHQLPSMAITFVQHPRNALQNGYQPELLNTFDERINHLSSTGIDYCLLLEFTHSLSLLSAKEFIQKKLKDEWHIKLLLIGYDHRFGKNRAEGFEEYVEYGKACGMEIVRAKELPNILVSSTRIRHCLTERKPEEANRMLTYRYRLEGKIIKGDRLGKKIGFPTANLEVYEKDKIIPGEGIYAVWVYWNHQKFGGMAYIGNRPTITAQGEKRIEVHLFHFTGDLYGEALQIEFVEFLREDKKFEHMEDLKKQLLADKEAAVEVLADTGLK